MRLDHFAQFTAYDMCSMYGFSNGPEAPDLGCDRIWTRQDRLLMTNYLNNARERVEEILGFPIYPRFICDERLRWNRRGIIAPLKWGYVQKVGTKTTEDVSTFGPLDLSDDFIDITQTVDFTDACEARIFHTTANGGEEIYPFSKSIVGTNFTAAIEKCKLVDPAISIPDGGLDYDVDNNFVTSVVIKRVYAAPGTGSNLVWEPSHSSCGNCSPCEEGLQTACPTIRERRNSSVLVRAADFVDGEWTTAPLANYPWCSGYPDWVDLDYVAYLNEDCEEDCNAIPSNIKLAIIHVALADLPHLPCGCNIHSATFKEDSMIPGTAEWRVGVQSSPFGIKMGHLTAWLLLQPFLIGGGGLMVG